MSSFKRTKEEAWTYYKTWMGEKTFSKLLNKEINITRKGWDHLLSGSNAKKRTIRDKHHKLTLLKVAKDTIKNASKYSVETKNKTEYTMLEKKEQNNSKVKVLLKKDKKGNYYFYSVMDKK